MVLEVVAAIGRLSGWDSMDLRKERLKSEMVGKR